MANTFKAGKELFVVAAKRTPIGTFGGSLKGASATDMGVHAAKAALASSGISAEHVQNVVFGNVREASFRFLSAVEIPLRMAALSLVL